MGSGIKRCAVLVLLTAVWIYISVVNRGLAFTLLCNKILSESVLAVAKLIKTFFVQQSQRL